MALAQVLVFLACFLIALMVVVGLVHFAVPVKPRQAKTHKRMPNRLHGQYQPSTL